MVSQYLELLEEPLVYTRGVIHEAMQNEGMIHGGECSSKVCLASGYQPLSF